MPQQLDPDLLEHALLHVSSHRTTPHRRGSGRQNTVDGTAITPNPRSSFSTPSPDPPTDTTNGRGHIHQQVASPLPPVLEPPAWSICEGQRGSKPAKLRRTMEDSDTQVMPTQVYEKYYSRTSRVSASQMDGALDDNDTQTYERGDQGYVDFGFDTNVTSQHRVDQSQPLADDPPREDAPDEIQSDSSDELAQEHEAVLDTVTSPSRFSPTTPALAGRKHSREGSIIEPTPAPDLSAIFVGHNNTRPALMGLSQLYQQTQGQSSPIPGEHVQRSDPVWDRPSPDGREPSSFRPYSLSSPVHSKTPARNFRPSTNEPRQVYESMQDSSERRSRQKSVESVGRSDSDDFPGDEDIQRTFRRRERRKEIREELRKMSAPLRATNDKRHAARPLAHAEDATRSTGSARRRSSDSVTHSKSLGISELTNKRQKDMGRDRNNPISLDETPRGHRVSDAEPMSPGSAVNSIREPSPDDEYDELSQSIIPSDRAVSRNGGLISLQTPALRLTTSPIKSRRRPMSSPIAGRYGNLPHGEERGFGVTENIAEREQDINPLPEASQEVIADSQTTSAAMQQPQLPSSNTSRVIVSQSQPFSSNMRPGLIDTSSAPRLLPIPEHEDSVYDVPGSSPPQVRSSSIAASSPAAAEAREQQQQKSSDANQKGENRSHSPASSPSKRHQSTYRRRSLKNVNAERGSTLSRLVYSVPDTSPASSHPFAADPATANSAPSASAPESASKSTSRVSQSLSRSHSTGVYATARSNLSASQMVSTSDQSSNGRQTARNRRRPKVSEVIAEDSPPNSMSQVNIDEVNIFNDDDNEFQNAIAAPVAPPPRKRPRITYGKRRALEDSAREVNFLQSSSQPSGVERRANSQQENLEPQVDSADHLGRTEGQISDHQHQDITGHVTRSSRRKAVLATPRKVIPETPGLRDKGLRHVPVEHMVNANTSAPASENAIKNAITDEHVGSPSLSQASAAVVAPRRVLARFKDHNLYFYPATCLGVAGLNSQKLTVMFDDGTVADVEEYLVRRFEFKMNEQVRTDHEGLGQKNYLVKGFKNRVDVQEDDLKTDIYGHQTILLAPAPAKSKRKSDVDIDDTEILEVPIATVKLTRNQYKHEPERGFNAHLHTNLGLEHVETPSGVPNGTISTPRSRTRRHVPDDTSTVNPTSEPRPGLFSNMVFAVTYSSAKDAEKAEITRLINNSGGRVLAEGFEELFEFTSSPTTTPTKASVSATSPATFDLRPTSQDISFAALIADTHSRRAKYMQALALNLPCLHGRWITDCIKQHRLLPLHRYLLPAGESTFLDGAVRSRFFPADLPSLSNPATAELVTTIANRPTMLDGMNVLLVIGKGKAEDRRKAYAFLTHALGARTVKRVFDLKAAKSLLTKDDPDMHWNWVYVDNGKVDEARRELANEPAPASRKRKRDSNGSAVLSLDEADVKISGSDRTVKVVGDEFVIQSLILGALVDA